MQVTVDKTVSYTVSKVDITLVQVTKDIISGAALFRVSFCWLDAGGNVLRQDSRQYTQAALLAAAVDPVQTGALIGAMKSLLTTGTDSPALRIVFQADGTPLIREMHSDTVDGKKVFKATTITEVDLAAHGLSTAIILGTVEQLAAALT